MSQSRLLLTWTLCVAILVPLSIRFVDRPVAGLMHDTFHGVEHTRWLAWMVNPVPALAAIGLVTAVVGYRLGWRPGRYTRVLLACAVALLVADLIKDELKFIFGRTWPETWAHNPSWIQDGVFGFFPFHGGVGWSSFPSGHTTVTAAPMAVLARAMPRWRALWALPVLIVGCGLIGTNYHFVSDVLAGGYLGLLSGTLVWWLSGRVRWLRG